MTKRLRLEANRLDISIERIINIAALPIPDAYAALETMTTVLKARLILG